jgi:hypothetical protein
MSNCVLPNGNLDHTHRRYQYIVGPNIKGTHKFGINKGQDHDVVRAFELHPKAVPMGICNRIVQSHINSSVVKRYT